MNPLLKLQEAGQSVWLDYLERSCVTEKHLRRLVDEDGLHGVTSNPTIFGKAIGGSDAYDDQIRELSDVSARQAFYELALHDIRLAADELRATYDETDGRHGFVSFELEADLARDTEGSISAAKDLRERIARPNVMIKVPGTPEGVPAVRELTAAGVNVNITLLFSVDAYEQVAEAYIAGLERRHEAGEPVDRIASVASFFVSRVDEKVDPLLPDDSPLRGRIAIANAKAAYQRFKEILSSERWRRLAEAGARPQRPLWASTGTKDPAYSDVLYVTELVGPDTVNTMKEETLAAFRDHGEVRPHAIEEDLEGAEAELLALDDHGIDLDQVTSELTEEGIAAFDGDFQELLAEIDAKLERLQGARSR